MRSGQRAALLCIVLAAAGCHRGAKARLGQTDEEPARLVTTVHVADAHASAQLVSGFYAVEQNAWRWTARRFSVLLRAPRGATRKGAVLNLKLTVPDPVIARLQSVTLTASIQGAALGSETWMKPGDYVFSKTVPSSLLAGEAVKVNLELDKAMPPSQTDQRELGIIVSSVGLESAP